MMDYNRKVLFVLFVPMHVSSIEGDLLINAYN